MHEYDTGLPVCLKPHIIRLGATRHCILSQYFVVTQQMSLGFIIRFIGLFDTAGDYTL
jgi:hypothetical protein